MSESPAIPLHRPYRTGAELPLLAEALDSDHLQGGGPFSRRCEEWLEKHLGAARAFLVPSGSQALDVAVLVLDIQPDDEVIVPSFTFVTTASAFALRGARLVFADIDGETLTLDPESVKERVGPRTRAIVPVHYAGLACAMDPIIDLANTCGATVVEDTAYGLFGTYRGRKLGTFGALATTSFQATKNLSCGEGGALIVNDASLIQRTEIIRDKGTDRAGFFRGEVDAYTWRDVGSNYLLSDLLAAVLWSQIEHVDEIQARRHAVWQTYMTRLAPWCRAFGVQLPFVPPFCRPGYDMFFLVLPTRAGRDALKAHLAARNIASAFHYQPLHSSPMGAYYLGECPVAEDVAGRLLRLPFFTGLDTEEVERVVEAVSAFEPAQPAVQ